MADDVIFFATSADFRAWLADNHDAVDVQWVGFYKVATGEPSITWQESVDEALCFGWIDGLRRSIDERAYKIRFTPRREGSVWSAKNIESVERLIAAGRMKPAGLRAFERRIEDKSSIYSYEQGERPELSAAFRERFQNNPAAWKHYQERPPGYRRQTAHWVMSAKREDTRLRRLQQLIDCSERGEPIPPLARGKS